MPTISIDFETRSLVDLRKTGVYPYAEDWSTDVLCMAYAIDGGPVRLWAPLLHTSAPQDFAEVVTTAELRAWNAGFEASIYREIMVKRHGFPAVRVEQWVDTAAEAAAMALPRSLGQCAEVLGLKIQKDDEGHKLMLKMCKPRCVGAWWFTPYQGVPVGPFATKAEAVKVWRAANEPAGPRITKDDHTVMWWESPEDMETLYSYCRTDVEVERSLVSVLRRLTPAERAVYLMNQRMNDRGIYVDADLVQKAQDIVDLATQDANDELTRITDGAVRKVTQVADLRAWIESRGMAVADLRKDTVRDLLTGDITDPVIRRALEIRQQNGKTSTAKLQSFQRCMASDGRVHGLLIYHAASTGRWAGALLQPQNFPRPEMDPEPYIDMVRSLRYDLLQQQEHAPAVIVSSMLRSMLMAAPGNVFMAADYAQIEARVLAWLAGQQDLVDLFATGGKIYETMAAFIFNKKVGEIAKDSFERQIGKNATLGFGFQMGEDRYADQLREQTGIVLDRGDPATGRIDMALHAKRTYRALYPMIPTFWRDINNAAIEATLHRGSTVYCGVGAELAFTFRGQFLWCLLPSGRFLCYGRPEVTDRRLPEPYDDVIRPCLSYAGVDHVTRQWRRIFTYGGHLTENVVQAIARDLMAGAMLRVEHASYEPVLTVHDEIVIETREKDADFPHFMELIRHVPRWANGLPVAAEGYTSKRYKK